MGKVLQKVTDTRPCEPFDAGPRLYGKPSLQPAERDKYSYSLLGVRIWHADPDLDLGPSKEAHLEQIKENQL